MNSVSVTNEKEIARRLNDTNDTILSISRELGMGEVKVRKIWLRNSTEAQRSVAERRKKSASGKEAWKLRRQRVNEIKWA